MKAIQTIYHNLNVKITAFDKKAEHFFDDTRLGIFLIILFGNVFLIAWLTFVILLAALAGGED